MYWEIVFINRVILTSKREALGFLSKNSFWKSLRDMNGKSSVLGGWARWRYGVLSDWGEFLLKFDLGPHVASLVMSTPLFVKLFMCGEGGAQVLG